MTRPIFYHNDRFRLGVLSGSASGEDNLPGRIADGDISLAYNFVSGASPSGEVTVTLSGAAFLPSALVLAKVTNVSGYTLTLESEDVGGGNNATAVSAQLGDIVSGVFVPSGAGAVAREVWRLTLTGAGGLPTAKVFEAMLADSFEFVRSVEVGVPRTRVRQRSRIDVPGGQPFTQRQGPTLKRTAYTYVTISSGEIADVESFIDSIDGGESFFHTDDRGESYWAELLNKDQGFDDQAGVFTVAMNVGEIRTDDT